MSAPATQTANGAPSQSPQQQNNSKPRSNGRSTPQDGGNRGGYTEGGDSNGYNGKQQAKGNPSYKKGWQAKADQGGANGQEDKRKGKERTEQQAGGDANSQANGEKRYDSRDRRNNRRERNFPNQAPVAQPEQPAQPAQPAPQQPAQVVQPNVDTRKVEESKRLSSLIATNKVELTSDQRAAVNLVKQAVPQAPETDIQQTLDKFNWDTNRAAEWLHEHPNANSWSEVVRKTRKEQPTPAPVQQEKTPRRERSDRPEREQRDRSDKAQRREERYRNAQERYQQNQQQPAQPAQQQAQPQQAPAQPAPAQQQQPHPQQQQPQHYHQQQLQHQYYMQQQQQQQYYQQMQQQQQQQVDADGESLIMGFSKAIELQLAEIAKRSSLLLQMQTELANIHATDKNQLTSLHEEKTSLLEQKGQLQHQLRVIEERLVDIDVIVEKTEQEKLLKIQDWQRRSAALSVLGPQLLTNQ